MNRIAEQIRKVFNELWAEDHEEPPPLLEADTILLETGFDSMAFAVLVAQLDDELGVDPFALDMDGETPVTFADFVGFYVRCLQAAAAAGDVPAFAFGSTDVSLAPPSAASRDVNEVHA